MLDSDVFKNFCQIQTHRIPKTLKEAEHYTQHHSGCELVKERGMFKNGKQVYTCYHDEGHFTLIGEDEITKYAVEQWLGNPPDDTRDTEKYTTKKGRLKWNWRRIK